MTSKTFWGYIRKDLFYYRGRTEIKIGLLGIFFATVSLLSLFAISSGVKIIVDYSLTTAKPILGVMKATSGYDFVLDNEQMTFLQQLAQRETSELEAVSFITPVDFSSEFRIWDADKTTSLPYRAVAMRSNDPLLAYVKPNPVFQQKNHWQFEIVVNTRFLTELLKKQFSRQAASPAELDELIENALEAIVSGQTPFYLQMEPLQPFRAQNGFELDFGIIEVPVSGFLALPDDYYPDIWLHYEIARALYFQKPQEQSWEPSYAFQFKNGQGNPLVPYQLKTILQKKKIAVQDEKTGEINWVETLRESNAISIVDQGGKILGQATKNDILSLPTQQKYDDQRIEVEQALLWQKHYREPNSQTQLRKEVREFKPKTPTNEEVEPIELAPLNYTLAKTINRINPTLNLFIVASSIIIMILSLVNISLFGISFVWGKRQDIGILRSCGLNELKMGQLFLTEIQVLTVIGIAVGIITTLLLISPFLEIIVTRVLHFMGVLQHLDTKIDLSIPIYDVLKTFMLLLSAGLLGSLIPTFKAATVNPIEQLRTQN
jgi:hypothetical protein